VRLIKMLGLGGITALIAMAFVGAGSASATALCSANETTCAAPLGAGTQIEARLKAGTVALLKTTTANVECTESETKGETTSGAGATVIGVVKSLTFKECKTTGVGGTPCTAVSVSVPYAASLVATEGGNGTLTVSKGSGGGNPGATVTCLGVIECTFRTPSAVLQVTGGNPATAKANEILLSEHSVGQLCPSGEAKWTATYEVLKPNPLWISELP
jgi:hypothetical protein